MNLAILLGICLGFGFGFLLSHELRSGSDVRGHILPSGMKFTMASPAIGLKRSDKILCWVPSRSSVGVAVERIVNTWIRRCDKAIILVHVEDHDHQEMIEQNPHFAEHIVARNFTNDRSLWNIIHSQYVMCCLLLFYYMACLATELTFVVNIVGLM